MMHHVTDVRMYHCALYGRKTMDSCTYIEFQFSDNECLRLNCFFVSYKGTFNQPFITRLTVLRANSSVGLLS